MELRQMKYFVTIANTRSYSDAAKSLFVTQPTLSWNMQKLEEELNVNLFDKSDNDIKLTKLGQVFYEESIKVLENVDNLLTKMKEEDRKENQKLKVGITVLFLIDRKSTRLNSSHVSISYAVFCLKNKTNKKKRLAHRTELIFHHCRVYMLVLT